MNRGLFWGVFFVTIGLLFLARNLGWIAIDWETIRNLWPLLLILAGVNLILERQSQPAALVTTVLLAIAIPVALFSFFSDRSDRWEGRNDRWEYKWDTEEDEDEEANEEGDDEEEAGVANTSRFVEAMEGDTPEAVLKFGGGAGRFAIGETTTSLIEAEARQTVGIYKMAVDRDPTTRIPTIELKPSDGKITYKGGKLANRINIRLNPNPVWTINLALGAGKGQFDLSQFAVKSLSVEAGAADLDFRLGDRADLSNVRLETGVASLVLHVPKGVGCRVEKQGGFNVNDLEGFTEVSDRVMQTPGYEGARKKIDIVFNGGVSRFKVDRY